MVLIFTDNEILNKDLNKNIENSRVVYYPDYILEEKEANVLIATLQPNKYNFKDFMFKVREKNIRVILILENEQIPELKDALFLGIYDFIFDPFEIEDIKRKVAISTPFSFTPLNSIECPAHTIIPTMNSTVRALFIHKFGSCFNCLLTVNCILP